jgi:hypothetical protein
MGYTHYWRGWVGLSDWFQNEIHAIIDASGVDIAGGDGTGLPIIDEVDLVLNGSKSNDEDYETFVLEHGVNHGGFCKTAHMPYDSVVCTILLRASSRNKSFKVRSDGKWDSPDWIAARDLYFYVFKEEAVKPEEINISSPAPVSV